jgi:hypothetical protein
MAEFNIRTDSVDVEQIMRQIRARIKEKRGVDYTEQQIQELANVKLERFLDPKGVRSDLVQQFKRARGTSPEPPNYGFEDTTLYESHRGVVRFFRKLLNPFLKLLFNPNPIVHVLHLQGQINNINAQQFRVREELDALYYEVIHNLVLEVTRLGIENKNLKMRVESLNSRMDFDERRARALEGVVQYKAGTGPSRESRPAPARMPAETSRASTQGTPQHPQHSSQSHAHSQSSPQPQPAAYSKLEPVGEQPIAVAQSGPAESAGTEPASDASGTARRRRRRRRGRRGGRGRGPADANLAQSAAQTGVEADSATPPHGDPTAEAALDDNEPYDDSESGSDSESGPGPGGDEGPDNGQ